MAENPFPNLRVPADWGELPLSSKWEDEIEWVHQNRARCVSWTQTGKPKVDLFMARNPAPSEGALGLMQQAADDPKAFGAMLEKCKRAEVEQEDADQIKAERRSIKDIRAVLAKFAEAT